MITVSLHTNIDAYRNVYDYKYLKMEVNQRPCVGDLIAHNNNKKLPDLEIKYITVTYTQKEFCEDYNIHYSCYLDFSKNTDPDLRLRILQHEIW